MEELQIRVLEGRWGPQVEYALRYPSTGSNTSFDRYWRQRAQRLRRNISREPGRFPTKYASEWQETRRDGRFCSGFLEISRRIGHGDWSLWRMAGTFRTGGGHALPLSALLGQSWKRTLHPLILQRLDQASAGETPFFRGWQRRMDAFLDGERYYLTGEGLCLWFPQEALAPKNAGLPTVILPYDLLPLLQTLSPDD